jgi:hypothetical protein
MRKVWPVIVVLALGLWVGGLVALLMAVMTAFGAGREYGVVVAPALFHRFEPYLVGCAIVSAGGIVTWRWQVSCSRAKRVLLALVLGGAVMGTISIVAITPRIDALREAGRSDTIDFKRLHAMSNVMYLLQLTLAGAAMVVLPSAIRADGET